VYHIDNFRFRLLNALYPFVSNYTCAHSFHVTFFILPLPIVLGVYDNIEIEIQGVKSTGTSTIRKLKINVIAIKIDLMLDSKSENRSNIFSVQAISIIYSSAKYFLVEQLALVWLLAIEIYMCNPGFFSNGNTLPGKHIEPREAIKGRFPQAHLLQLLLIVLTIPAY